MSIPFCCTSVQSVGCTFMDWSIHFLSGQEKFQKSNGALIELSKNPVNTINAHGHERNHPVGFSNTVVEFNNLLKFQDRLTSLYPTPRHINDVAQELGITPEQIRPNINKILDQQITDYNNTLHFLNNQNVQIVFVDIDNLIFSIFLQQYRSHTLEQLQEEFTAPGQHHPYASSRFRKQRSDFSTVWEFRDYVAATLQVLQTPKHKVDLSIPHLWVDSRSWWYNGVNEIQKVMAWLNIPIDVNKLREWEPIYRSWQDTMFKQLQFQFEYNHIVDSIVNNWSFAIDLTLAQEIVIQHCLIYQHNKNLKTQNLEKFPNNTKELHKLLIPNVFP
jgi:hypothetical protein